MSIVLELQAASMNSGTDITELLRKAHLVAYKLSLKSFEKWTNLELSGYDDKEVPPYRHVDGSLKAWNPYNGWIPLMSRDPNDPFAKLSHTHLRFSVGVIQESVERGDPVQVLSFSSQMESYILSLMELPLRPALHVSRSAFVRILDEVRNVIFKWSLKLERDGILGEGMTFTPTERKAAQDKADELRPEVTINVNNIYVASMNSSVIQQGSPDGKAYFDPE